VGIDVRVEQGVGMVNKVIADIDYSPIVIVGSHFHIRTQLEIRPSCIHVGGEDIDVDFDFVNRRYCYHHYDHCHYRYRFHFAYVVRVE
jgi:hypothetical protein